MDPSEGSPSLSSDDLNTSTQLAETLTVKNMMETDGGDHETPSRAFDELERVFDLRDKLLFGRDVVLVAGEILKLRVKKESKEVGDRRGYFPTIQCLDAGARRCRPGINTWPNLLQKYPDQEFKQMQPGSFK